MKSVLISIKPKWCEKIAAGEKTIEVRKNAPKPPFKVYIYETKDTKGVHGLSVLGRYRLGKVVGEFICDKVYEYKFHEGLTEFNSMGLPWRTYGAYLIFTDEYKSMCLSYDEVKKYGKGKTLYGWHISDLRIYDKPRELSEFKTGCKGCKERDTYHCYFYCYGKRPITRPPQSYMYVEDIETK